MRASPSLSEISLLTTRDPSNGLEISQEAWPYVVCGSAQAHRTHARADFLDGTNNWVMRVTELYFEKFMKKRVL